MYPRLLSPPRSFWCILVGIFTLIGTITGGHLVNTLTADNVKQIDTSSIPQVVLDAVQAEKPNGVITGAELETEAGVDMYEITVTEGGIEYEIDVSPTGEVLEVIVDDDSDDEMMLKIGYALSVVSPVGGLSFFAYAHKYWRDDVTHEDNVGVRGSNDAL